MSGTLRFGTDGLRGEAGSELTPEVVLALGRVAGRLLAPAGGELLVGRDTRRSGPMLQAALSAGLAAEGVDAVDLGVLPTPGVASAAAAAGVPAAVISASHNPFPDNGIKLFGAGGHKLDDALEAQVEHQLRALVDLRSGQHGQLARTGLAVGRVRVHTGSADRYVERLVTALEGRRLEGVRVALDCGHGAAAGIATRAFEAVGAAVVATLGDQPDGTNINAGCGSTDPSSLVAAVVATQADVGLAFDGDADRVIAVDGNGKVVDGDRLLGLFALDLRSRHRLADDTVVVTVMTNLGFHRAMAAAGVVVHQTAVGDRAVLAALEGHRWSLGGEQSGHLVFRDLATTGDGLLSGLLLVDLMRRAGRSLAQLAGEVMESYPQVLRNVVVANRDGLAGAADVWAAARRVEADLAERGRVLLRPSGTEPLVRVMVEAPTEAEADAAADLLCEAVRSALGPR